ncbi:hypothetical protein D3C86_1378750 [compost metagenome]
MAPPPRMIILEGTSRKSTASRAVSTTLPSAVRPGKRRGRAPVAMITCLALTSSPVLTAMRPGATSLPRPLKTSILFFFIRKPRPEVCFLTTAFERSTALLKSGLMPSTVMPNWSECLMVCSTEAFLSSALVGMQPQFKQVPPSSSASTTATLRPS